MKLLELRGRFVRQTGVEGAILDQSSHCLGDRLHRLRVDQQTGATGEVGSIEISAKALNGFKIAFTGSAKSVTLQIRVKGGMT